MENVSPQVLRQVAKELLDLQKDPPEGVKIFMNEDDITDIQATVVGPGAEISRVHCLQTSQLFVQLFCGSVNDGNLLKW